MKLKRLLALVLSLCMVVSLTLPNAAMAAEIPADKVMESRKLEITEVDGSGVSASLIKDSADPADAALDQEIIDAAEEVPVIIVMEGDSVIEEDSSAVLNRRTEAKMEGLEKKQAAVVAEIEETVLEGKALEISHNYTWLLNGVAASVPYGAIGDIEAVKGVKQVLLQRTYAPCETDVTTDIAYPMTISDGVMIGRENTWAEGYTGEGIKIAIIDTGIDTDHQNFQALGADAVVSATPDTVAAVLDKLNASRLYAGSLTVDKVYQSSKIAYAFDYGENDTNVNHDAAGEHGTHVAGIAAANKVEGSDVVGVAPDAQLYVMKVSDSDGAMMDAYILAALEDALILGADVVNMSLGSPAGFTSIENEALDAIYERVSGTGTILAVSAGNSYTMGSGNAWGTEANLTSNPDNAVVAAPSTYVNVLSVASVENAYYMSAYITANGYNMSYIDSSYGTNAPLSALAGETYQIVAVPGLGEASDYEGLDVEGKIVLVQRGVISFIDKCEIAEAAGAAACLISNSVPGSLNMDLTGSSAAIPCAAITMSDGAYLRACLEEDPGLTVTIGEGETLVASDVGYQMSDFSSWGVAPDLTLEPDITAPGGNIYSTLDGGNYGLMSGTSMASPNVAGLSALVVQYVKDTYGLAGAELHSFVKTLLMSTSVPVVYDGTLYYSPRSQGSGLADAYRAVATRAYLSVDGCDVPKAELGDDAGRTGSYEYGFDVNNLGGKDLFYELNTVAQSEGVNEIDGRCFMASTPVALGASTAESSADLVLKHDVNDSGAADSHDAYLIYQAAVRNNPADEDWTDVAFRYNLDADEAVNADDVQAYLDALVGLDSPADLTAEVLKAAAGKTASVSVNVNLTDADKEYFYTYYENGSYVEGFTLLTELNAGGVDLSLPYLAFYGGWDEAPVIDSGFYWQEEDALEYNQYINILWTQFGSNLWQPGLNPYLDEAFDRSHISLSPNGDGYADYIDDIYVSLLRNAASLSFTYTDEEGKVYSQEEYQYLAKSYYLSNYGICVPFVLSWVSGGYDLTDENGDALPNNTRLTLSVAGAIDYAGARSDVWETGLTVDTEAPGLLDAQILHDVNADRYYAELTFKDNLSVAGVNFLNSSGTVLYGQYLAPDEEAEADGDGNLVWTARYDITGLGDHFMLVLGDYALNESYYELKAPGNDIELDGELLYGYRVADSAIHDDTLYGWLGMQITEDEAGSTGVAAQACSSEYDADYSLTAAEQVGGYIIACNANNDLVWIRPGYWDERNVITHLDVQLRELCYDPTTETLYGLTTGAARLVTIDIHTGALRNVDNGYLNGALALTCDDEGTLYGVYGMGMSAQFRTVDKQAGTWGQTLLTAAEGMPGAYYSQSMTYKDGVFYWAQYGYSFSGYGNLYTIALNKDAQGEEPAGTVTKIGAIAGNAEIVGLLWLDTNEFAWPEDTGLEALTVTPAAQSLLVGTSAALTALQTPWYCGAEVAWSSSDETVATVNADGRVTAVGVGEAAITAAVGDISSTATVSVVDPRSELIGFVFSSLDYSVVNQWASFCANAPKDYELLSDEGTVDLTAAEYLDGVIYAYDTTTSFYAIDPADFSYRQIAGMVDSRQIIDMAYDYTTGNMYGLLADYNYGETSLVTIDLQTGRFQTVGYLTDSKSDMAVGIAVDNDGIIYYVCDGYGFLCTYDPATWETTVVGLTGYIPYSYIQSMTYDHDTGELYWAAFTGGSCGIMYLDQATGQALEQGNVAGGAEIIGLHTAPVNPPETPYVAVEEISVGADSITLVEGSSAMAPVEVLPYNATDRAIRWTVADESVAAIEGMTVTAGKAGTTTAVGTLGELSVELEIRVVESAGAFRSYVSYEFATGSSRYWAELYDSSIHAPGQNDFLFWAERDVYAAAYYNGYLWTYGEDPDDYDLDTAMHFQQVDAETGEVAADYAGYDYYVSIADMAFDYTAGSMYAVGNTKNTQDSSTLYAFDLSDGKLYAVAALDKYVVALACSEDGRLYTVDTEGVLYRLDKTTGALTAVGETGYEAHGYQSMAFHYGSGKLYWAQSNYVNDMWGGGSQDSAFLLVDTEDASVLDLGSPNAMLVGLHFPTENEPVVPDEVQASSISLSAASLMLCVGESETLTAMLLPISVRDVAGELAFASSDESVAAVAADGTVTAVAPGRAVITVACGDISAACTVSVLDDTTLLYAMNASGWESTPLLDPGGPVDSAVLGEELGLTIVSAAYNTDDGYVYAMDAEDCLWKLTLDLGTAEQIGKITISEGVYYTPEIIDIAYNPYAGGLYALVGDYCEDLGYGYFSGYYVYELSTEDASASPAAALSEQVYSPVALTFNGADTFLVYDVYNDFVYQAGLGTWQESATAVLWAQQSLVANEESLSMIFSKDLNRLFIVTSDGYYGSGNQALYMFNPEDGSFGVIADGAWTENVVSLLLIEGAAPAAALGEPEIPEETAPAAEPETPEETASAAEPEDPKEDEPAEEPED